MHKCTCTDDVLVLMADLQVHNYEAGVNWHVTYRRNYTPLQGSDNKRATHIFWRGPWWKPRILTFKIAPLYRFWENRDVILHVKSMGKIACVGTITKFELKICHCCELSSYCYLNDYQGGLRYTLEIWRQSRLTSHFRNQIKRFGVCLEASCSWLSK